MRENRITLMCSNPLMLLIKGIESDPNSLSVFISSSRMGMNLLAHMTVTYSVFHPKYLRSLGCL